MMVGNRGNAEVFHRSLTSGEIGLHKSPSPYSKQKASRTVSDSAVPLRTSSSELFSRGNDRLRTSSRDSNTFRANSRELASRGSQDNSRSSKRDLTSRDGLSLSLGTSRLAQAINERNASSSQDPSPLPPLGVPVDDENNNKKNVVSRKLSFKGLVNLANGTSGVLGAFRRLSKFRRGSRHASLSDDQTFGQGLLKRSVTQPAFRQSWQIAESDCRFGVPGEAKYFFKKMVRRCLNCLFWIQLLSNEEEKQLKTFVDLAKEIEEISFPSGMKEAGLAFDKNYYKANREINLSQDVLKILTLSASARTPEMVQQVMAGLQTLRSFAEYPLHMQAKLAEVAWYQVVPQKKMIIRQGHEAQNFYFILGGQAIMKAIRTDSMGGTYMATVGRLKKGASFGEVALLHQTGRECTVQTVSPMQLLVIYRDDFFRIFMNRGVQDGNEPDHIKFCRKSVNFLKFWPIDLLLEEENEDECLFHFYRRGTIVLEDSNKGDWIYIVKSGTCEVLKQLHSVEARSPRDLEKEYKKKHVRKLGTLPRLGTAEPGPKIESRRPYQPRLSLPDLPDVKMRSDTIQAVGELFKSVLAKKNGNLPRFGNEKSAKPRVTFNVDVKDDDDKSDDNVQPEPKPKKFFNPNNYDEEILTKLSWSRPSTARSIATPPPIPQLQCQGSIGTPGFSKSKLDFMPMLTKSHMSSLPPFMKPNFRERSKSVIEDDEDSKRPSMLRRSTSSFNLHDDDVSSVKRAKTTSSSGLYDDAVFVQVGLLKPKDSFGLETIQFDDEVESTHPQLSLVSRGAELIMLSKKFFMKHCNDLSRQWLREKVRPYPEEPSLQDNLQTRSDWEKYKHIVLKGYTDGHEEKEPSWN